MLTHHNGLGINNILVLITEKNATNLFLPQTFLAHLGNGHVLKKEVRATPGIKYQGQGSLCVAPGLPAEGQGWTEQCRVLQIPYEVLGLGKYTGAERLVVTGGWGWGDGELSFNGNSFSFG